MERSPLQKQNKAITSLGTLGRQTYGGTFYKRWEVSQYLGITACKEDKKFSGLFDSENTKSFAELHAGVKNFLDRKLLFLWLEPMGNLHIFREYSCAFPGKDKTTHKLLFGPVLPSSHINQHFWDENSPKTQKFLPWQCHEGLFLVSIYMRAQFGMSDFQQGFDWDLGEWKEEENLAGQAWGIQIMGLDHETQGHVQKLGLQAKYFA